MNTGLKIAVLNAVPEYRIKATAAAKQLALPLTQSFNTNFDLYIAFSNTGPYLQLSEPDSGTVSIDFNAGANAHRRKFGGGNNQTLARAVGLNKWDSLNIVDATGGLARDAFVMASLGAQVVIMERSPILCLLIESALIASESDAQTQAICQRMSLSRGDSIGLLLHTDLNQPDVIYLDPMYPLRQKSAAVKKDMQLLHKLVGQTTDSTELLDVAMRKALKRVVVKRPIKAEPLSEHRLTGAIKSTNTRYDIYAPLT